MELDKMIADEFKGLEAKINEKFEEANAKAKQGEEANSKLTADLQAMGTDFEQLQKSLQANTDALNALEQKGVKINQSEKPKTWGQSLIDSEGFKSFVDGKTTKASIEVKNTIIGEGGSPQDPVDTIVPKDNMPGIIGGAFRPLRILDVIPTGVTSSNQIHYTKENTFTNNAAETSESSQKPESVLTFTGVDAPVRTIAHTIKVSKQVLDDAPALATYIDRRMSHGVSTRIEDQILNGNGTSPNLSGILTTGNHTDATYVTADNDFDLTNRMKYQVIASDYQPDFYMVNPADWGVIERLKRGTGDDAYVGAGGAVSYVNNGLVPVLWGLPVVVSSAVPQGSVICAASDAMMYWNRQGITVEIFNQNEDDVEKNLLTVRAEARGAFSVFRPAAVIVGSIVGA